MNFANRLLVRCSERVRDIDAFEVELLAEELVERLLLFDHVILDSLRLKEVPELVRLFGYDETMELLNSGIISIRCEPFASFGSVRRAVGALESRRKKGKLPLFSYCLDPFEAYPFMPKKWSSYSENKTRFIQFILEEFRKIDGLSGSEIVKLQRSVKEKIVSFRSERTILEISDGLKNDLETNDPTLIFAISQKAAQLSKINIKPEEIECKVEYLDDTDFGVSCNIQRLGDIDDISADQIIERALLGMAEISLGSGLKK
jgi:hypothetical protein